MLFTRYGAFFRNIRTPGVPIGQLAPAMHAKAFLDVTVVALVHNNTTLPNP